MEQTTSQSFFDTEFFPTPWDITQKMLAKVSKDARHFLEPSAGKGDIARTIQPEHDRYHRREVDCIEANPDLCAILQGKGFPVVGYDWLTYDGVCYYDAILMNPPFSNGDAHLLKAWDFLHSGEIVCLLNAETINNPYTASRKRLAAIIEHHGEVEHLGDCFSKAERRAGVDVVMVYLKKVSEDDSLDLWATGGEEKAIRDDIGAAENLPAMIDRLGNLEHFYNMRTEHAFKAFQHLRKFQAFLNASGIYDLKMKECCELATKNVNEAKAEFTREHRKKAWLDVFRQTEFHKFLDKKQVEDITRDIERNANIPFTAENIKQTLENVFVQRDELFLKSVANVFNELTRYFKGNTNHGEGWKSNDGYKVNKKLVFPWGCNFDYGSFTLRYDGRVDIYNDLDRVLCKLDGKDFGECGTIGRSLQNKFQILGYHPKPGFDNTTESQYFHIRFFKKGTVHLTFKYAHLLQQFNMTAAKGKAWIGYQTQNAA